MEGFNNTKITDPKQALQLLKNYILISKAYGSNSCLYALSKDKILVINDTRKYYITEYEFISDFFLADYYIYKGLSELEIDQEFRKLRQ